MRISYENVERIIAGEDFTLVFFKTGEPIKITERVRRQEFLERLRLYKSSMKEPLERVIHGFDDINEHGVYDFDVEQAFVRRQMNSRELKKNPIITPANLKIAYDLKELTFLMQEMATELKERLRLFSVTISKEQESVSVESIEIFKNVIVNVTKINALAKESLEAYEAYRETNIGDL